MFDYLKPTEMQIADMAVMRQAARDFHNKILMHVPEGPDKTYMIRKFREVAMWANVAITRHPDGTPRK